MWLGAAEAWQMCVCKAVQGAQAGDHVFLCFCCCRRRQLLKIFCRLVLSTLTVLGRGWWLVQEVTQLEAQHNQVKTPTDCLHPRQARYRRGSGWRASRLRSLMGSHLFASPAVVWPGHSLWHPQPHAGQTGMKLSRAPQHTLQTHNWRCAHTHGCLARQLCPSRVLVVRPKSRSGCMSGASATSVPSLRPASHRAGPTPFELHRSWWQRRDTWA